MQTTNIKKYDNYKNSGIEWIGEIPQEWSLTRLKQHYHFEKGKNAALYTNEYIGQNEGLFPVYSGQTENEGIMGQVNNFDYNETLCVFTTTVGAKVMTPRLLSGKFCLSQNCLIMLKTGKLDERFLYYQLLPLFDYEKSLIPSYMQPSLRISDLKQYWVINCKEPQQISDYLDKKCGEIDNVIDTQKDIIKKLKEYKQAVITETVTKGLDKSVPLKDSGIEYLSYIPAHWKIKRLRYIATCQNGINKGGEFFGKGSPFVTYGDVYNNLVLPEIVQNFCEVSETEKENYSVKTNDIFFTRTSETIEEIALACVCKKTIENATFAGFLIRVRPYLDEMIVDFVKYYFTCSIHREFFVKEMNLVTRASLSQELLKKLPVLLPPKDEQKQLAEYLDKKCSEIDTNISEKEKLIEKLTEYKKSLIYECVTGKRKV